MLKINLNLSSYKWTPYQIRLYIKENWVFIFEREFCPVFFYTIVDISWTTRLRHYKTTKVVDHTQRWKMMVVDVNAQKNYKAKRRGRSITVNVSDLVSPTL